MSHAFSRRAVLLQLGAAGLAAGTPGGALAQNPFAAADPKPWSFLSVGRVFGSKSALN